jgi:hypothetical protein
MAAARLLQKPLRSRCAEAKCEAAIRLGIAQRFGIIATLMDGTISTNRDLPGSDPACEIAGLRGFPWSVPLAFMIPACCTCSLPMAMLQYAAFLPRSGTSDRSVDLVTNGLEAIRAFADHDTIS